MKEKFERVEELNQFLTRYPDIRKNMMDIRICAGTAREEYLNYLSKIRSLEKAVDAVSLNNKKKLESAVITLKLVSDHTISILIDMIINLLEVIVTLEKEHVFRLKPDRKITGKNK